ncbi:MAG: putative NADH-flavin reductase [Saprospiraceae bacterium]|jgi:putative NADH-flavin reductase
MSRICIFGADGRTGVQVVKTAVLGGHSVVAFVYSKAGTYQFDESVEVIQGNILDEHAVEKAVRGVDSVISVVGHIKDTDSLMQTKGIQNVISGMTKNNIKRLISLTGTGARTEGDSPSVLDRFLNMIIAKVDPERISDGKKHVEVLQKSGLDWTVLRVLKLTNKDFDGDYSLTWHGPAELFTSRAKVAKIMVDLATSSNYIHKMPISS